MPQQAATDDGAESDNDAPASSDAERAPSNGTIECRATGFVDCCADPRYDCGMTCVDGTCVPSPTAPTPSEEDTSDDPHATEEAAPDAASDAVPPDEEPVTETTDVPEPDVPAPTPDDPSLPIEEESAEVPEEAATESDTAGEPTEVTEDNASTEAPTPANDTVEAADATEDPVAPIDDLSNAASWRTDDLIADVPDWTPARVRTVLDGFSITDLPAFLIGFVSNPLTMDSRDAYLLLETDPADPRWDLVLGPVAGMSGSPIIIEGRNAGALSFSVGDDLGPYLFIATPIEKMLNVDAQELDAALTDGASPSGDPLAAIMAIPSGAAAWFDSATWADDRYLVLADDIVAGAAEGGDAPPLAPGSAIAVMVISGDVLNFGGIGTVTAVDGDALWAFGHPMFGVGDVGFPFRGASIEAIAASAAWGFSYKVGAPAGPLLGAITNDRTAAIAGRHGIRPPTVQVFTHGTYTGATEHLHHETARLMDNPWFNASQALFAAVWPLTVQRDTPFGGTGSIAYEVQVYVAETDAYASHRDILSSAWWPEAELFFMLFDATAQLIGNDRLPLTLTSVILTANVSDDRREFTIGDLTHAEEIAPGDELVVAVELLPFGSTEPETRALVFAIPEDFPSGHAELQIGSEMFLGSGSNPGDTWVGPMCGDTDTTETPEDLIAKFNAAPRQQVLVGQLKSQAFPKDDCPPCVLFLDADGNPKSECTPCEPKEFDPCAPPVELPNVRVSSEENGMILGFRTVTIKVTGLEEPEGVPECQPEGCSETPSTDPEPTSPGSGTGDTGSSPSEDSPSTEPTEPTEPTETPCVVGNEVCDGCDNDGDGVIDDGCP